MIGERAEVALEVVDARLACYADRHNKQSADPE